VSDTADYSQGEPPPTPNDGPSMHDLVIDDLSCDFGDRKVYEDVVDKLIVHMDKRKEFGLKKYNTILQAFNGRNPVNDALEEFLDALVYLRQCLEEGRHLISVEIIYSQTLAMTLELLKVIEDNEACIQILEGDVIDNDSSCGTDDQASSSDLAGPVGSPLREVQARQSALHRY
jgi:hypothetical protein